MKYVIMVGHGGFVSGLYSAVKMMIGEHGDTLSISLKADTSADEFTANFRTLAGLLNADDGVIPLADILSGSPFTSTLVVPDEEGLMLDTLVFAGMNMPLAVTAILMKDNFNNVELLKEMLLSEGHAGLTEFKVRSDDAEDDI